MEVISVAGYNARVLDIQERVKVDLFDEFFRTALAKAYDDCVIFPSRHTVGDLVRDRFGFSEPLDDDISDRLLKEDYEHLLNVVKCYQRDAQRARKSFPDNFEIDRLEADALLEYADAISRAAKRSELLSDLERRSVYAKVDEVYRQAIKTFDQAREKLEEDEGVPLLLLVDVYEAGILSSKINALYGRTKLLDLERDPQSDEFADLALVCLEAEGKFKEVCRDCRFYDTEAFFETLLTHLHVMSRFRTTPERIDTMQEIARKLGRGPYRESDALREHLFNLRLGFCESRRALVQHNEKLKISNNY